MGERAPLSGRVSRGRLALAPLFGLLLLGALPAWAGTLMVDVLDVGQGDAIFIRSPENKTVLIDAGPGKADVVAELRARGVTGLDLVVATHPHSDHIGGMEHVLSALPVGTYMDSGQTHTTSTYGDLMEAVAELGIPYARAEKGQRIQLGSEAVLWVLWPGKTYLSGTRSDHNSNSVVLRLEHQGHCMLFTGDAEAETEQRLLAQRPAPCEVLKVAHHGGAHSTSGRFLDVLEPRVALISVGDNGWGHPTDEALGRLRRRGIEVHRTDQAGTIRVLSLETGLEVQEGVVAIQPGALSAGASPESARQDVGPPVRFAASVNSEVFHEPACSWALKISPENRIEYDTYEEATADGRRPASCCHPEPVSTTPPVTSLVSPAPEEREESPAITAAMEPDVPPVTRPERRRARRDARLRRREERRQRR